MQQAVLDAIPFVAQAGLELVEGEAGRGVVRLPFRTGNTNHVGGLHAGALGLVGETAAGAAALSSPALAGLLLLAKGLSIRYRKQGKGDAYASAQIPAEVAAATAAKVAADGKADLDVPVEIRTAEGELLAELVVQFHFRKTG